MRRCAFALLTVLLTSAAAFATPVLWDWSANIQGSTYNPPALPAYANTAAFDFSTGLGTITFTITGAGLKTLGMWFDGYIDEGFFDQFNEYATANGAAPAGLSWMADWPFNTWPAFAAASLTDANGVPASSPPPNACCDTSAALLWNFVLAAGETATVNFSVGTSSPGGFAIQMTDSDNQESVFYKSTLTIQGGGGPTIPEPSTFVLIGAGLAGFGLLRRKPGR